MSFKLQRQRGSEADRIIDSRFEDECGDRIEFVHFRRQSETDCFKRNASAACSRIKNVQVRCQPTIREPCASQSASGE